jgi:hypothetical protein
VARHRQLAAATEGEPVQGRNDGFGAGLEAAKDLLPGPGAPRGFEWRLAFQLRDVGAGDERATGTREQDPADVVARTRFVDGHTQLRDRGVVERVQFVGPIDGDRGDPVRHGKGQELVGHRKTG